jgi:hypothetical protein
MMSPKPWRKAGFVVIAPADGNRGALCGGLPQRVTARRRVLLPRPALV